MSPAAPDSAAPKNGAGSMLPAVIARLQQITKRADFLAAARASRQACPGFVLQARNRRDGGEAMRIGFTASKKVGNAVARNRAKRRLRALARAVLPAQGRPGWDYVLIGRLEVTATRDFKAMQADLTQALAKLHKRG